MLSCKHMIRMQVAEASARFLLAGTQPKIMAAHPHAANPIPIRGPPGNTEGAACVPSDGPELEASRSGGRAELEDGPKFTEVEDDEWLEGVL